MLKTGIIFDPFYVEYYCAFLNVKIPVDNHFTTDVSKHTLLTLIFLDNIDV